MTDEDWKAFIAREMERDLDDVMAEINADPAMKDIKAPESIHDNLMVMIREYERQKAYEQLSDEDKELIRLGKAYKKRRVFNGFVVAMAAVIVGLSLGSVCVGDDGNIFKIISSIFVGQEQTTINSEDTEVLTYIKEHEAYAKIEEIYKFKPVRLRYLPEKTVFYEAIFSEGMQGVNLVYEMENGKSITYTIRPNYRESSFGATVEDEKIQEYTMNVKDNEIVLKEYNIVETGENRWMIFFQHKDVQYMLNLNDIGQAKVENIVKNLGF